MGFLLATIIVLAAIGISAHAFLVRRLRSHHSNIWEELGSPTLVLNNSISNGLAVQKCIRSGRLESLDDPVLARTSKALRCMGPIYVAAFAVHLALFALQAAA